VVRTCSGSSLTQLHGPVGRETVKMEIFAASNDASLILRLRRARHTGDELPDNERIG
jgi:hypothetical protein